MKYPSRSTQALRRGFTLVEMMIVAPIVILAIGAFITVIVNLTGEILSSRGSNMVTYNVQNALNRMEEDIKLSAGFLQTNSIKFTASNPQGQGGANSTNDFTALGNGTTGPALILTALATDANPLSLDSRLIYLANQPNNCSDPAEYAKNRPMVINIVYFIEGNTLWRRVVMPNDYNTTSTYCGSKAPWQRPTCVTATSHSFCKANDERLVDNISANGLSINYFSSAAATTPIIASSNTLLQPATSATVSITSKAIVAGREVVGAGSLRVSRLDTNASTLGEIVAPTAVPSTSPTIAYTINEGHKVSFTWPRVPGATNYSIEYRLLSGAWTSGGTRDNDNRLYEVSGAWNGDAVSIRVVANNVVGGSAPSQVDVTIPVWSPLLLKNGWTDYGQGYSSAAYTKTKAGVILIKGLVKGGSGTIGTLPDDYRPDKAIMFASSSDQTTARLDVNSNGDVNASVGSSPWFSLDGVAFMPAGTSFTALSYQNSWSTFDTNWNPASYAVDSQGRVHLRGLVKGGTTTSGTIITTLPAAARAAEYTHWVEIASNAIAHISYVPANTSVIAKGYSNSFLSINAMYYTSSRVDGTNCTTQWCTLSLQNGWVHYASPYSTPRYTKGADGVVKLKGLIRAGTSSTMATLPAAYCPNNRLLLTNITADVWGRIDIVPQSDGSCIISGSSYSTTWVSLDSIQYLAD